MVSASDGTTHGIVVAAALVQGINRGINLSESERTSEHENPANTGVDDPA
jgi:Na+/alanine symporter